MRESFHFHSHKHIQRERESLYSYQSVGHDDHTLLFVLCYESISVFHVNAYESLIGDQYKHGGGKIQTIHVKKGHGQLIGANIGTSKVDMHCGVTPLV